MYGCIHTAIWMNIQKHFQMFSHSLKEQEWQIGMAFCHYVPWHHDIATQFSRFCSHNPLYCFSTDGYCCAYYMWSAVFQWLNHAFPLNFASHLGTLHHNPWNAQMALSDNAIGKTRTFDWFYDSYMAGTLAEDCEHLDNPSTGPTDWNIEKSVQNCEERQSTILLISLSHGVCHPL